MHKSTQERYAKFVGKLAADFNFQVADFLAQGSNVDGFMDKSIARILENLVQAGIVTRMESRAIHERIKRNAL